MQTDTTTRTLIVAVVTRPDLSEYRALFTDMAELFRFVSSVEDAIDHNNMWIIDVIVDDVPKGYYSTAGSDHGKFVWETFPDESMFGF